MKIRQKIFLIILPIVAIILIAAPIVSNRVKNVLQDQIESKLIVASNSRANHIQNFINLNLEELNLITSRTQLRNTLEKYNDNPSVELVDTMRGILDDAKKPIADFKVINIIDLSGKIIVSTEKKYENTNSQNAQVILENPDENKFLILKDRFGDITLYLSGPLKKDDKILGVAYVKADIGKFFNIVTENIGFGETEETFIVDSEGFVLSPLKDQKNTILEFQIPYQEMFIEDINTENDLANKYPEVNIYKDYKNQEVLGINKFIPDVNWFLLAEIDTKEAFAPVNNINYFIAIIITLVIIIMTIIANYLAKIISQPIKKLQKGVEIIENGDLNYKVGTQDKDEIGQLSREFDNMTGKIKKSRAEIDVKVEEQTRKIKSDEKNLQDQQKAILNILEDVNEEKLKTEHERNKIQAILSSIGDAVFVIGLDEKIIMFNSIAEKMSGYKREEAVGKEYKNVLKFYLEKDNSMNDKFVRDAMTSGKITYMTNHTYLLTKYNKKIPVADSASPLRDKNGKIIGCVVVFHDVTKERELSKMKDEFLNIAAHDLRTPMTAIKGYNDMMLSGDFGEISDKLREPLQESQNASERLIRLVNDFLTSSRIERGKITVEPKPIDIVPIINTLIKQIEPIAKKKNLELSCAPIPEKLIVYADSDKIQQVITNLIDNAIKYTKEGSIKFDVKVEDKFAQFSITDTGQGISEEKQENLFTKYYQVSGGTKKVIEGQGTGLGLGLYISRLIVEGCGGKIWVESREGHGSKFSFSLPLAKIEADKKQI